MKNKKTPMNFFFHNPWKWVVFFVFLGALAAGYSPPASAKQCGGGTQGQPGTTNCDCGDRVISSYTMTQDLVCTDADAGLIIGDDTNNSNTTKITLDCGTADRHMIRNIVTTGTSVHGYGITSFCQGSFCRSNFEITNCRSEGWDLGIMLTSGTGGPEAKISNVIIRNNSFTRNTNALSGYFSNNDPLATNIIITGNDFLDMTYGMNIWNIGSGVVSNNRVIVSSTPLRLEQVHGTEIFGNYFDCHSGAPNCYDIAFTGANLSFDNTLVYDNVFASGGFFTNSLNASTVHWCPYGQAKKNIWKSGAALPPDCDSDCGTGLCSKECFNPLISGLTKEISENTCLSNDPVYNSGVYNFSSIVPQEYPFDSSAPAFWISKSNTILFCDQTKLKCDETKNQCQGTVSEGTSFITGTAFKALEGVRIGKIDGLLGTRTPVNRATVIGCDLRNFREGVRIVNSSDALLRANIVQATTTEELGQVSYYYHMDSLIPAPVGDPTYDITHLRNDIFPKRGYVGCSISSFESYYRTLLNYIKKPNDATFYHVFHLYDVDTQYMYKDGEIGNTGPDCLATRYSENFKNTGHVSLAKANGVRMHDITIDHGDPILLVDVSGKPNTQYNDVYNITSKYNADGIKILRGSGFQVRNSVFSNNTSTGMSIMNSYSLDVTTSSLNIYSNTLSDNDFSGMYIAYSNNLNVYSNTLNSSNPWGPRDRLQTYGAFLQLVASTTFGVSGDITRANNFNYNKLAGVYMEGGNLKDTPTEDKNYFSYNNFDNNWLWGFIGDGIYNNRFVANTFFGTGLASDLDGFAEECKDKIDNDEDGACDYCDDLNSDGYCDAGYGCKDINGAALAEPYKKDPQCGRLADSYESYPQAIFINQASQNLFSVNTIKSMGGDGIYIDSGILRNSSGSCPTGKTLRDTDHNIFIDNIFDGRGAGNSSGVVMTSSGLRCSPVYPLPGHKGDVYKNAFGFFYLNPLSRSNYSTDPNSAASAAEFNEFNYFNRDKNGGVLWSNPYIGGNAIINFAHDLDGIILTWNKWSDTAGQRIYQNDFFGNTLDVEGDFSGGKMRNGIFLNNKEETQFLFHNDIIYNGITDSRAVPQFTAGIYLSGANFSRVFGNTTAAPLYGIVVDKNGFNPLDNYNEIGNAGTYLSSIDYTNFISNAKQGIRATSTSRHRITANSIMNSPTSEYGIYINNSPDLTVNKNIVSRFTLGGIYASTSDRLIVDENTISGGASQSRGLAIIGSTDWKVGETAGNTIYDITSPGRYLYVGPDPYTANSALPYPFDSNGNPDQNFKKFYVHVISGLNKAGPTLAGAKPVRYVLSQGGSSSYGPAGNDTYHLQVIDSGQQTFDRYTLDGADPVEFIMYRDTAAPASFKNSNITNCRGECLILNGFRGYSSALPYVFSATTGLMELSTSNGTVAVVNAGENIKFEKIQVTNLSPTVSVVGQEGMKFINTKNSSVVDSTFSYPNAQGLNFKQWEFFLQGGTTGNTFLNNTFGLAALTGIGAFEWRPEKVTSGSPDPATDAADGFCSPQGTGCDPNCTKAQDSGCTEGAGGFCSSTSGNCCRDTSDSVNDTDCLLGVDPDNSQFSSLAPGANDGICRNTPNECDPNCTVNSDFECAFLGCTSGPTGYPTNDCCVPSSDTVCDYDCPAGFDPDCAAQGNTWCDTSGAGNTFNLKLIFDKPNYFISPTEGGGGKPNDTFYCYDPRAKFSAAGSITQRGKYRELGLGDRDKNIFRFNVADAWFADLRGKDLIGRIYIGPNGTNWYDGSSGTYPNKISSFVSGSFKYAAPDNLTTDPYHPTAASAGNYRLGDLAIRPIKTRDTQLSAYPATTWTVFNTAYSFVWDAIYMKVSPFTDGNRGSFWAFLEVKNSGGRVGSTGSYGNEGTNKIQFNYDFQKPSTSSWNFVVTPVQTVTYPKTYKLEWTPVTELSWTPNTAHYEVWFGEDATEVKNRTNSNTSLAGPFMWDDLATGSATIPTRRGVLPHQSCQAPLNPAVNLDCHDTIIGSRDCQGLYGVPLGTKCQTIVKVQDPSIALPTYTIQGEYYTSDATIRACATDNTPTSPLNGIVDNVDNFGSDTVLEADMNDNNCTGNNEVASLIKWNTSALPSSSCPTVASATVFVNIPVSPADAASFKMYEILKPWTEDGVTWKTTDGSTPWGTDGAKGASDRGALLTGSFPGGTGTGYKSVSISAATVQNWISSPSSNNGVIVVDRGANDLLAWHSSEGTEPPKLVITCAAQGTTINNPQFNVCAVDDYGNYECSSVPDIKPWVETRYGNIYGSGDIGVGTDIAQGQKFGTYIIRVPAGKNISDLWLTNVDPNTLSCYDNQSNPINCDAELRKEGFDALTFPQKSSQYAASLGALDFLNQTNDANYLINVTTVLNKKYGSHNVLSFASDSALPVSLGNKIYYYNGNLTMGAGGVKTFNNNGGAGLVIVKGNLTITNNIKYNSTAPAKLSDLASVVWLILGDIQIASSAVNEISGAFISLGTVGGAACPDNLATAPGGCGRISTGHYNSQLKVNGLLAGKQLNFERSYTSASEGAELILYDGRIQANPPLGVEDIAKNFPRWR